MQRFQAWNAPSLGLTRGDWGVLWPVAVVQSNYWTSFVNTDRHAECCWIFKVLNKLRWRSLIYQSAQESCQTLDRFGSLQKLLNNIPSTWIYPADPSGFLLSKEKFETIQNWHVNTPQYTLHFHNSLMLGPAIKKYIKIDHKLFPPNFRRNLSKNWDSFWDFNPPLGGPRCKFTHPSSKDAMVVVNGAVGSLGPTPGCWCDGHWKLDGPLNKGKIHETLEKDRWFFLVGGEWTKDSADHDFQPDSAIGVRNFCV